MKAGEIIARAQKAYAAGNCLSAGQLIDRAYRRIGMRPVPRSLKQLDEKFERTCVRKHPTR